MSDTAIISISIHKGGSGKTSIAGNLAYALRDQGKKILLIDTDSQMNLTRSYGMDKNPEKNFYNAFMKREDIRNHILKTDYEDIDIVVSAFELAGAESEMGSMQLREFVVREILEDLKEDGIYDYVIIDTNPSLGMLNTSVLYAADRVLIPIEPTSFGVDGLDVFIKHYDLIKRHHKDLDILGIVLNKIDGRKSKRNEIIEVIEGVFGDYILDTEIKIDSKIENSQWQNMPLIPYLEQEKERSRTPELFESLAKEVMEIV